MDNGNWIKSREFPTLWLAMLGCMELPIGKIRTIDKLSVYMYTSTVGFIVSVSLLCDGRLQWSSSHLFPLFQGKHSKEGLTVTEGYYKVWRPLSTYFCQSNTHRMICYYVGLNGSSLSWTEQNISNPESPLFHPLPVPRYVFFAYWTGENSDTEIAGELSDSGPLCHDASGN